MSLQSRVKFEHFNEKTASNSEKHSEGEIDETDLRQGGIK